MRTQKNVDELELVLHIYSHKQKQNSKRGLLLIRPCVHVHTKNRIVSIRGKNTRINILFIHNTYPTPSNLFMAKSKWLVARKCDEDVKQIEISYSVINFKGRMVPLCYWHAENDSPEFLRRRSSAKPKF